MGYDAPYVPGWDCHGLPIEHKVEQEIGKAGVKVDYKTFRQACRDYATKQIEGQKADFIRLGVMGEWDKPYLTMDPKVEAGIVRGELFPAFALLAQVAVHVQILPVLEHVRLALGQV